MTTPQSSLPGRDLHARLRKALHQEKNDEIDGVLAQLEKVCSSAVGKTVPPMGGKKHTIDKDELKFWLVDVGRLMFNDKSARTRELALKALESGFAHMSNSNYQDHSSWGEFREIVCKEYTSLLDTARSEKDPNWHRVWSILVRIVNRDLCQGSSIINMFLSIVEAGFRSQELTIREQSFDCWRLLVDIFAKNKQINIPKRVKLICIPLKSSKSKTETIALKKFGIWWFLLCQLQSQLDSMADTIFEPFIYFCFGPTFKTPLCYYFDESEEYVAPGKAYQSIKQLSAIALIHLLGPAPEISKTLLIKKDNSSVPLTFEFPENGMVVSDLIFATKTKLIIDSCIECTVLFAQMKHLDYLQLNRCLWDNLINRINAEKTVPKADMLHWIKEVMTALLKLCIKQQNDLELRDLLYDTLLNMAKSDLFNVNVVYDSPEQLMFNYKMFMSFILHPQLPCPVGKSEEIVKCLFNLERYSKQNAYWDVLQKTVQYICHNDEDNGMNSSEFRTIRTQIFSHLGNYLVDHIRDDPAGFAQHQTAVMSFLLYPLEYERLLVIDDVEDLWVKVYGLIVKQQGRSCDFTNSFCEMIKAMTVAKHAYNLEVVANCICHIMHSLSEDFELTTPPVKVLELFKDVARKGLAYQTNLDRIEAMVCCFRELLEKLHIKHILILVLPIRNAVYELVTNEQGLAMSEVKNLLKGLTNKIAVPEMTKELTHQPNEVKWNCKMLMKTLLELPENVKKGWKVADMKQCMNLCDSKSADVKTPSRKAADDEYVKIDSVWQFKPEMLTEHQREKMMEKRTDIPALYNDMSQSQDSFVIKPWTPSKPVALLKQDRSTLPISAPPVESVSSQSQDISITKEATESITVECEADILPDENTNGTKAKTIRSDKENNNGNVLSAQSSMSVDVDEQGDSEEDGKQKRKKYRTILDQLRIDTVEGKTLDVLNLSRTRRSDALEVRTTRRKSVPHKKIESEKKAKITASTKQEEKSISASKVTSSKGLDQKQRRSSRKLLNFGNNENSSSLQTPTIDYQPKANVSDDVIESSQATDVSETSGRRLTTSKSRIEASQEQIISPLTLESGVTATEENRVQDQTTKPPQTVEHIEVTETENHVSIEVKDDQSNKKLSSDIDQISKAKPVVNAGGTGESNSTKQHLSSPSKSLSASEPNAVQRNLNVLLSPSRRSARLSADDREKFIFKMASPSAKKAVDEKTFSKLPSSPSKLEIQSKGTPTKRFITACDSAAFNMISSSKNHGGEGDARFCPLVVLEPIKDFSKSLPDVEIISHPVSSVVVAKENDEILSTTAPILTTKQPFMSQEALLLNDDSSMENIKKTAEDKDIEEAPVQEQLQVEGRSEASEMGTNQLSPVKNLDEEMEPLNKSLNRSIVSSPDLAGEAERNADLLNNTLNISPIAEDKHSTGKNVDSGELAGSSDRRSSNRIMVRERDVVTNTTNSTPAQTSVMSRRTKASPTPLTPSGSNAGLKSRATHQQSTVLRSPSSSIIGMGGRGAQLINLIRNQQNEQQSPKPNTPPQNASTPKGAVHSSASANRLLMRKKAIAGSVAAATIEADVVSESTNECEETGQNGSTQYLVFSKVLPSPQASPASSILKRRHNVDDSGDDIESPVLKRKRVSFHDPPVSVTKEYIRQVEECRPVSVSRSLQLSSNIVSSADKAKFMMRRKSKSDSISELQDFTNKQEESSKDDEPSNSMKSTTQNMARTEDMEGDEEERTSSPESIDDNEFMMHDGTDTMTALQVTSDCMDIDKDVASVAASATAFDREQDDDEAVHKGSLSAPSEESNEFNFSSEDSLLEHVMNRYTLDDILDRYIAAGKTLEKSKSVRTLTKELSAKMTNDPKTRDLVLDELSERHSVEFLNHAIQENSSEKVCERLSTMAMIDHVFKQLHAAFGTMSNTTTDVTMDEKNETLRVVEHIYDKLLTFPSTGTKDGKLVKLRERFLREELGHKSRLEIMSLLEDYFKAASSRM
uniref:Rif1_N domain-containing protein n=1 Tax=Anopheles dirus TaxID=7168 RepID=A0A182NVC4_9DIPT